MGVTSTDHIVTPTRVSVDTLSTYLNHKVEPIFAKDVLMGGLKANGRITYGESGVNMDWGVRYKRREITAADGYDATQDTPRTVVRRRAVLPWRRFRLGESITKFERLANRGQARLYDIVGGLTEEVVDDFIVSFRRQFFKDGNATGSKDLHGFESFFSYSSTVTNNARLGNPNDSYAGMSTALGNYGGSWSPDVGGGWPTTGGTNATSREYCFWSPMILNAKSASWTATTKTFPNTWQECLRYAMSFIQMLQDTPFDMVLMNPTRLLEAKQSLESVQRFELTQNSPLTEVGFRTLAWEGLELMDQPHVPTGAVYMFPWDKLTLRCMGDKFVDVETDTDPSDSTEMYFFDAFCNLQVDSPAFCAKIEDF